MKILNVLSVFTLVLILGCAKDKNMEDYRRDQLQQSLSRISAVSGVYTGSIISKLDGTNLGGIMLKFQARTDVQSNNTQVSNEQNATVSGSLSFKSVTSAEIVFDNGFYDDVSGDFQVTIPIAQDGGTTSKLSLIGNVGGGKWIGNIEVKGQPEFGGELNLTRNAPLPNISSIEVGGTRLQQINKMNYNYLGQYTIDGVSTPFKLSFINRDVLPEQSFYKLFSPIRTISVNCDFSDFELNFPNAILDDKSKTLVGRDPVDQRGVPAHANLNCVKFEDSSDVFGWDCQIQTKSTVLNLHLAAKK